VCHFAVTFARALALVRHQIAGDALVWLRELPIEGARGQGVNEERVFAEFEQKRGPPMSPVTFANLSLLRPIISKMMTDKGKCKFGNQFRASKSTC
jgi:hypothetical protein